VSGGADDQNTNDLIEAALSGEERAYEALYRRFVGALYRLAYGVLLNRQDAEEVVQDSFAYAFRALKRFDPAQSAFKTWLYTITMSRCRNKRRRKWLPIVRLADVAERLAGDAPTPESTVMRQTTREIVLKALGRLSPKLREAVVLRYFEDLTYREIGEVLGCPAKTAESRVRLAHDALYDLLDGQRDLLVEHVWSTD
jgi:RNA polymerase sigma-70 factor (ECF subfamily)